MSKKQYSPVHSFQLTLPGTYTKEPDILGLQHDNITLDVYPETGVKDTPDHINITLGTSHAVGDAEDPGWLSTITVSIEQLDLIIAGLNQVSAGAKQRKLNNGG